MEPVQFLFREVLGLQREAQDRLAGAFSATAQSGDGWQWLALLSVAAFFGMVHAVGPGHGKSIVAAYFLGQQAQMRHGLWMSLKVIVTHVGSAIVLVLGAITILELSFGLRPADFPLVRLISYAGVTAMGLYLTVGAIRLAHPSHTPAPQGALPYFAGLSPCPLTTIIMVAAISTGATTLGVLVSISMASGMVVTVTSVAALVIFARTWLLRLLERHARMVEHASRILQLLGALLMTALGTLLFLAELR